jgi:putative addiction module component (TIGR02574 family)
MSTDISIETMSVAEKVRLLESVWESLCAHPGDVQSLAWHREVLEARRRRLEDGRATVSAWADAKAPVGIHEIALGYHRFPAKRFPFCIDYTLSGGMLVVDAVIDARRDPLWIRRRLR